MKITPEKYLVVDTWEVEARGSLRVQVHPGLCHKTLSPKAKQGQIPQSSTAGLPTSSVEWVGFLIQAMWRLQSYPGCLCQAQAATA